MTEQPTTWWQSRLDQAGARQPHDQRSGVIVQKDLPSGGYRLRADICPYRSALGFYLGEGRALAHPGSGRTPLPLSVDCWKSSSLLAGIATAVILFPILKKQNERSRWAS